MTNPFDHLELARDLVRRDEAQRLFDIVSAEHKRQFDTGEDDVGGLAWVLDVLDERIGWLRDRWG
jgi:hypothetical protein